MKRKILYAAIGVLALFIITNPSVSAFKDHLGRASTAGLMREHNYFLFSRYKNMPNGDEYNGVVGNFWRVEKQKAIAEIIPIDNLIDTSAHEPKAIKLYHNLLKVGLSTEQLGTPDDFIKAVSDSTKAMKLYANLRKAGLSETNLGTPKEFKQAFCN